MKKGWILGLGALILLGGATLAARMALGSKAAPNRYKGPTLIKVGTGVEKADLVGEGSSFTPTIGSRIYAWAQVVDQGGSRVSLAFYRGEREMSRQDLAIPRSPHRTWSYRTFRKGDEGSWSVRLLGQGGQELARTSFTVSLLP